MNDNHTTIQMLLTTALVAAFAALLAGPASAKVMDGGGGGGSATVAAQPQFGPGTIPYMSHGIGVDESLFSGEQSLGRGGAAVAPQSQFGPGTIPYMSHGIGVDESLFSGATVVDELDPAIRAAIQARESSANVERALTEQSLGLTGDSPITRVVGLEPQGLTGDSPRTRGQVYQANTATLSSGSDVNWTWVGFGAGLAALLAAAMGALYFSARNRDRVALP